MSIPVLYLNKIQEVAQVSTGKAKQLMETCVWCLAASSHINGVSMRVMDESYSCSFALRWPDDEIDMEATNRSFNEADATEDGAEAIGILLSRS